MRVFEAPDVKVPAPVRLDVVGPTTATAVLLPRLDVLVGAKRMTVE